MRTKNTNKNEPVPVSASADVLSHSTRLAGAGSDVGGLMRKLPHFPFYPRDFISDPRVTLMSNAEVGAYIRLLCHGWTEGGIPADRRLRARVMQEPLDVADDMWHAIAPCWQPGPTGLLVNNRMEQERSKAVALYEQRLDASAKAAEARRRKQPSDTPSGSPAGTPSDSPNSELRTQNTETQNPPSVPNGTADGEKWNDRLAPLCRTVGGDKQVGNWLKYWGPICTTPDKVDYAEELMWGVRWLADKGQLEETHGIKKGDPMKPAILKSPRADILVRNALEAYHRHAPDESTDLVRKLTAI